MSAEKTLPSYSKRSPPRMPRRISTESRIVASGFVTLGGPPCLVLLRKILEVPKPAMKRPGPAASCTRRASMATCTGMARVGRDDPPADRQALRLAGDDAGQHRRGLGLHAVLAPPGIGLGEPDRVEARLVHDARRLEHLLERLHRQLHHADAERNGHAGPSSCFSSAVMIASTCWLIIGCSTRWPIDASTPARFTSASHAMCV